MEPWRACRGCRASALDHSHHSRVFSSALGHVEATSRQSAPACRGVRLSPILGCSSSAGESAGPQARLRTNAASSLSVPVPAACPWPRPSDSSTLEYGIPLKQLPHASGPWAQLQHLWQRITREGELPPELRAIAYFSDGPGVGKAAEEEESGLSRFWRHQGLKF